MQKAIVTLSGYNSSRVIDLAHSFVLDTLSVSCFACSTFAIVA